MNSCTYDPTPNSFDCVPDSYHSPHPTYETYSYDSYGNDSQFRYDCQPQFSLNYESEQGYNENYTSYPYDSSSLPQQYPCCTRCGGPHMNFQCQPMNQDFYSLGFDQPQPPQSSVIHQPPQELSIQEMEDLKHQYLDELKHLSNLEYRDEIKIAELTENFNGGIDDDIPLTIKDDNLRDKLLNVHLLIANIEALKDNPTQSSELLIKSSSTSLNSFLEETNTFHNSLLEFENFYFDLGEISSGSTTTHSDISLSEYDSFIFEEFVDELAHIISPPEYDCFYFKDLLDPGELMSVLNSGIRENLSTT
nr:hypothetical protein [Tanacetum cinerariifolium]GFB43795.1 hypothetical protein [Tanacetum cinerariifolium]